jgi:uncharacterized damage-inducible protein DinB/rubredoxin
MAKAVTEWNDMIAPLMALAARLEGEGQYNIGKLARAAADSLSCRAAYAVDMPTDKDALAQKVREAADGLAALDVNPALVTALRRGADIMAAGDLPMVDVTPHVYVCRTCGYLLLREPTENCPNCDASPDTFRRFLPSYWLDALDPLAAMVRLRQTPGEVEQLLEGLTEEQMNQPPPEGGWSIRNILSHIRDAQGLLGFRVDLFLKEEHPRLESQAVFAWSEDEDEAAAPGRSVFETYQASRADTVKKLEGLPLVDWWRSGDHEEFGTMTLRQQVSYFASHELTHLRSIGALRRQAGKV